MRIHDNCVSTETIKILTGGHTLHYLNSLGHYPTILDKKGKQVADIVPVGNIYLGDDVIIKQIRVTDNKELSKELTDKYRSKILIFSILDIWN